MVLGEGAEWQAASQGEQEGKAGSDVEASESGKGSACATSAGADAPGGVHPGRGSNVARSKVGGLPASWHCCGMGVAHSEGGGRRCRVAAPAHSPTLHAHMHTHHPRSAQVPFMRVIVQNWAAVLIQTCYSAWWVREPARNCASSVAWGGRATAVTHHQRATRMPQGGCLILHVHVLAPLEAAGRQGGLRPRQPGEGTGIHVL